MPPWWVTDISTSEPVGRELGGVGKQIGDHLGNAVSVALNRCLGRDICWYECDAVLVGEPLVILNCFGHQRGEIDGLKVEFHIAGCDPFYIQDVFVQLCQKFVVSIGNVQ